MILISSFNKTRQLIKDINQLIIQHDSWVQVFKVWSVGNLTEATFTLYQIALRSDVKKTPIRTF
jgi:hypothetical protein